MLLRAWSIWFVATLFVAFQLFIGMLLGMSVAELSKALSISAEGVSNIVSLYFLSYACMQIPAGYLIDRVKSVKLTLLAVIAVMIVCLFMLGFTHSFFIACISVLLMGAASSFNFVAAVILIERWLPEDKFSVAVGLTSGANGLLASLIGYLLVYLIPLVNIGEIYLTGIIGFVIFCLMILVISDHPDKKSILPKNNKKEGPNLFRAVLSALANKQIILASMMTALVYGSMLAFITFWNIQYQQLYGIDMKIISIMNIIALTGIAIGAPVLGWISEKTGKRKSVAAGACICLFILLIIIFQPVDLSLPIMYVVMFLLGFFANNVSIGFSIVKDNADPRFTGTAIAFANTLLFLSLSAFQFFPGKIAGIIKMANNVLMMSYASEKIAILSVTFSVYLIAVIISFLLLFFIKGKNIE